MIREALTLEALNALEPREAAATFVARRAEGLTDDEQQLLTDWLAQDEAHKLAFESADRAWVSFDASEGDEILSAMRVHALAEKPRGSARWRPAALVGLLVAASAALVFIVPGLNPFAPSTPAIHYANARGAAVSTLALPDGSSMTLDADSAAVGHFNGPRRSIELTRGRAFFAVMTDATRPFDVAAAGRSIVAVGTRFDVNLATDGLTVTLLEGHVRIGSLGGGQAPIVLEPGQQYVESQGHATVRTIGAGADNVAAWRDGLINFDDEALGEAATVMNRYSNLEVVITDPAVNALRVSGQFRAGDTERFANTLAELHNLRARRQGNRIELSRQ